MTEKNQFSALFDGMEGLQRPTASPPGRTDVPRTRRAVSPFVAGLALLLAATALAFTYLNGGFRDPEMSIREFFRTPTPHEAYFLGLSEAGLSTSALGRDWMRASQEALLRPLVTELPYREEGFFPPEEAAALGYRLSLRRGQQLTVTVELDGRTDARVFVDLFRAAPDTLRLPVHVYAPEPGEPLIFEPRRSGDYLLRIQPELLRGGRFEITIENPPALAFPVAGLSYRAIGSFFGDPRDGGRRDHHGVDIFAPRGTPVIAAADAYVRRTDTTQIGGRVIWLRDSRRNASLYFAHLNEILVEAGTMVRKGDTIGRVGNTGNARTTPPHLHFGLYLRGEGPFDPWDFLYRSNVVPPEVRVALTDLGRWARTRDDRIYLRDRPGADGGVLAELPAHTPIRLLGGVDEWFRVRVPDGSVGFVAGRLTEEMGEPLWLERVARGQALQSDPQAGAPIMDRVTDEAELPVLGTFGEFLYVEGPGGRAGWMLGNRPGPR